MPFRLFFICALLTGFSVSEVIAAQLIIHPDRPLYLEMSGYDGLAEETIWKGDIPANGKQEISTSYQGLALLNFPGGQSYPVILGVSSFTLQMSGPEGPPSFADSDENTCFYQLLAGAVCGCSDKSSPADLLVQAQHLLDSTSSLRTVAELSAKKQEVEAFVDMHYESLRHSDLIRRLITQYFMMHEYIDYQTAGKTSTGPLARYQQEVVGGVGAWLRILSPRLPRHEILNYCVSLYYQRSMVSLASLIIKSFREDAFCPGAEGGDLLLPQELALVSGDGRARGKLGDIKGQKMIALVSEDCPVSLVETVVLARQASEEPTRQAVIAVPVQELSQRHLAMAGMIRGNGLLFIDDEPWRQANRARSLRLPRFRVFAETQTDGAKIQSGGE